MSTSFSIPGGARSLRRRIPLLLAGLFAVATATSAAAQADRDATLPVPQGPPQAVGELRDPDFGVRSSGLALERQVEMYQWHQDDGRYVGTWSGEAIDSSGFDAAHRNPEMPVPPARWAAGAMTLDGHPIDPALLDSEWRPLLPDLDALHPNMAATFQPDASGLTTAADPAQPEVGDLRLRWRERVPATPAGIVLVDGRWQRVAAADDGRAAADPAATDAAAVQEANAPSRLGYWIIAAILGVALVVVVSVARRRR
ncbi:TMEM43 family protein [Coralloluteibacterium stylophorae]|uniref:DUF2167 domain-containing protein n=1 Tax=Coralloluteibacterium stylophorae TaxID=1776034 RepID=A0A8J7VRA3_9GAMM|nr:hypothetical protein [Coralloluteibacterium stylophorae]